jgi:hypothetical protein
VYRIQQDISKMDGGEKLKEKIEALGLLHAWYNQRTIHKPSL